MEWRSMETYPAPEEPVLVADNEGRVSLGHWHPNGGWIIQIGDYETDCEPLYWMPLPEHPHKVARTTAH